MEPKVADSEIFGCRDDSRTIVVRQPPGMGVEARLRNGVSVPVVNSADLVFRRTIERGVWWVQLIRA